MVGQRVTLFVLGSAPCLDYDLDQVAGLAGDVAAVNCAGVRFLGKVQHWFTAHPEHFQKLPPQLGYKPLPLYWEEARAKAGGESGYFRHSIIRLQGVVDRVWPEEWAKGTSTLLTTLAGLAMGYEPIILVGAPLSDERYKRLKHQQTWLDFRGELIGKVFSVSGWTRDFLGSPEW